MVWRHVPIDKQVVIPDAKPSSGSCTVWFRKMGPWTPKPPKLYTTNTALFTSHLLRPSPLPSKY